MVTSQSVIICHDTLHTSISPTLALRSDVSLGHGPSWAAALKSSDYELLCRDGTRAPVRDWQRCHLVRVPFRGIIVGKHVTPSRVFTMLRDGLVGPSISPC